MFRHLIERGSFYLYRRLFVAVSKFKLYSSYHSLSLCIAVSWHESAIDLICWDFGRGWPWLFRHQSCLVKRFAEFARAASLCVLLAKVLFVAE